MDPRLLSKMLITESILLSRAVARLKVVAAEMERGVKVIGSSGNRLLRSASAF